ncbi:LOW QUALITY PROTEIN: spectrin beta chain, erythrocytic-like [Bufo gargarizans]|uniref:LOW QUALITY PROTEIN: spectrin beta chain, erythrocytic-like n=1 Tax=Bufo gargarizans TaxID=30331 RepID=UPI001CF44BF8|nr:LOW QUALITY PROTEIN: spectrin beta chain, erythrocytic-like [Bufo gargarizans]
MQTTDFDNVEIEQQYSLVNSRWEATEDDLDNDNSSARMFERSRIKALADEREVVQKKTFTKWVNSHLAFVSCRISDLYLDLRDGRMLLKLLEVLSGEQLPRRTKGRMRIHCLENVDKALHFLREQKVHLENIGPHDIVNGNHRLVLGLIWTIILRFQIQGIVVETKDSETLSAKDALLLWCQMKTAGYPNVNVTNFTSSWKDGLAFNALIHRHRPELINFEKLKKSNAKYNLENAFNVADRQLGITQLLDPEDVYTENPDEKSIITYVVAFYHYFSKMKALAVEGKRIGKVLDNVMDTDKTIYEYERLTSDLLTWIEQTIIALTNWKFANSLLGVQQQLQSFSAYRTVEKPPKFKEKGELEVLLFSIQSRMRENKQKVYVPRDGQLVSDINRAWGRLEKAEHDRETALRNELIRQEKLEQLAKRLDRKAAMREAWVAENQHLISQDNFGCDLPSVEASMKKHEAIQTDIFAYEGRIQSIVNVAKELENENYHDVKRINARKDNIVRLWEYLLERLHDRRQRLNMNLELQVLFQDMLHTVTWMDEMKNGLLSPDFGKHLNEVEYLLQKHLLTEADIAAQEEKVKSYKTAMQKFVTGDGYKPCDPQLIKDRVNHLELCYQDLVALAAHCKAQLLQCRRMWKFFGDMDEIERWIKEKEHIYTSMDFGKDLTTISILQRKHKAFEDELKGLESNLEQAIADGEFLIANKHPDTPKIQERMNHVKEEWAQLKELAAFRLQVLRDTENFFQFQVDADDLAVRMQDSYRIMQTDDIGQDEYSTNALVKKHKDLLDGIMLNRKVLEGLNQQVQTFPEEYRTSPEIDSRLQKLKALYSDLASLADLRSQKLQDTLAYYTILGEIDSCEMWMNEKETWLEKMVIPESLEDMGVVQHRFNTLGQEMNAVASQIENVNNASEALFESGHPNRMQVKQGQDHMNARWGKFQEMVANKRKAVDSALGIHNYGLECEETQHWILEKIRVVDSIQDLGDDLTAVMSIQRKLYGIERDLGAIENKLITLQEEAKQLANENPDQAQIIYDRLIVINNTWQDLQTALQNQEDSLGESSKLQKFLVDLFDFETWIYRAQQSTASEDTPTSLAEAEQLYHNHLALKEDMEHHEPDFHDLVDTGNKVTRGQTDPQYQQLAQRVKDLEVGWSDLHKMWSNREHFLSQCLEFQKFLKDVKQSEAILSNQEYTFSHTELPNTLQASQNRLKKHEDFLTTMENNEEKIVGTINNAGKLDNDKNIFADKAVEKAGLLRDRYAVNVNKAKQVSALLQDHVDLQDFVEDCDEFTLWINEKMLTAQDTSYEEARNLHSKWLKHQAFKAEIDSNKDRLEKIDQKGQHLAQEKPQFAPTVSDKLSTLHDQWNELESTTQKKEQTLFDAHRSELHQQRFADIATWIHDIEVQVASDDYGKDLTSVNILLNKHKRIEDHINQKTKEMGKVLPDVPSLAEDEVLGEKEQKIKVRFLQLQEPMQDRKRRLQSSKQVHQLQRDLADEILWVEERMPLAESKDYGNNLQMVQMLLKKNQTLQKEIAGHGPRVDDVIRRAEVMEGEPDVDPELIKKQHQSLQEQWDRLQTAIINRQKALNQANKAQQYYMDANEAGAWIDEQHLYLMGDEKPKDEETVVLMLKKHLILQQGVEQYGKNIKDLAEQSQKLLALEHPDGEQIIRHQDNLEKQYAALRDRADEQRQKLDNYYHMFQLRREVEDLEQWIAERDIKASSQEMGQNLDHVTILRDKFRDFAKETGAIGQERIDNVNILIEEMIDAGHSEAVTIAEWKDNLNESWADLLELIDTRVQLLSASYDLHKYFYDGTEILSMIDEKHKELPEELGGDVHTAETLHRVHTDFERGIHFIGSQVQGFQQTATRLYAAYAGDQAMEIQTKEREVTEAWKALLDACDGRRTELSSAAEKFHFFSMVRNLMLWMESIIRQIETQEKPRDVSSVEFLIKYHQELRAEIEARNATYSSCVELGETLLARNHPDSEEIKEKLGELAERRAEMMEKWDKRWEWLNVLLEVCQFARDASMAEAWLIAKEPYLLTTHVGNSVDDVEKLLKKHEAFEKSTATWEERFAALERLTTLELLEIRKYQEATMQQMALAADVKTREVQAEIHVQPKEEREYLQPASSQAEEEPEEVKEVIKHELPSKQIIEETQVTLEEWKSTKDEQESVFTGQTDYSVLHPTVIVTEEVTTLPADLSSSVSIEMQGYLLRKHDLEGPLKKAQNRSWNNVFCVLKDNDLIFYKDLKSFSLNETLQGEEPLFLGSAACEVVADYKKKKHVFRLRLNDGNEWLLQGKDEADRQTWINVLRASIAETSDQKPKSKSLPLPSTSGTEGKSEKKEKRFSLFPSKK